MTYLYINASEKDEKYAQKLNNFFIKKGFNVWSAENDNPIILEKAIKGAGAVILVMSSAALESKDALRKLSIASSAQKEIFPLLIEGRTWALIKGLEVTKIESEKMPPAALLKKIEAHVPKQNVGELVKTLPEVETEEAAFTQMHRPQDFFQLKDALRSVLAHPNDKKDDDKS